MTYTYIQVQDLHLAETPPRGRTLTYFEDIIAKLEWVVARANELEASGLVICGDLWHSKNARNTSHRAVQRVRSVLDLCNARVSLVAGNHDEASGGGLEGQPLLSVIDGSHIVLLDGPSEQDPLIGGVAWSNEFEREGGAEVFAARVADLRRPLVFCHAPIANRPFPFGPEAAGWMLDADVSRMVAYRKLSVRLIAHGHMHGQQTVSHWGDAPHTLTMSNPGALSRATVSADDVARVPAIAVIEYDWTHFGGTVAVRYEDVQHRPAAEVLRVEEHERDQSRATDVARLATSMEAAYAEEVDGITLLDMLRTLGRPDQFDAETWARGLALAAASIDEVPA